MIEYEHHIEKYSLLGYHMYSHVVPESEWGDKKLAKSYLEKYWLSQAVYDKEWQPRQDKIFINQEQGLPAQVFSEQYELLALRGGVLLEEVDFKELQKCMLSLGDKHFVVIENTFGGKLDEPPFRMKYPTNISWKELISGNFISSILFEMFHKEYFIFSESGVWGRYSANEYQDPLNIIGFASEYKSFFRKEIKISQQEEHELSKWLPPAYKNRVPYR